jgi:hypothetical protein
MANISQAPAHSGRLLLRRRRLAFAWAAESPSLGRRPRLTILPNASQDSGVSRVDACQHTGSAWVFRESEMDCRCEAGTTAPSTPAPKGFGVHSTTTSMSTEYHYPEHMSRIEYRCDAHIRTDEDLDFRATLQLQLSDVGANTGPTPRPHMLIYTLPVPTHDTGHSAIGPPRTPGIHETG